MVVEPFFYSHHRRNKFTPNHIVIIIHQPNLTAMHRTLHRARFLLFNSIQFNSNFNREFPKSPKQQKTKPINENKFLQVEHPGHSSPMLWGATSVDKYNIFLSITFKKYLQFLFLDFSYIPFFLRHAFLWFVLGERRKTMGPSTDWKSSSPRGRVGDDAEALQLLGGEQSEDHRGGG